MLMLNPGIVSAWMAESRPATRTFLQKFHFEALNTSKIRFPVGATLEPRPGVLMRVTR